MGVEVDLKAMGTLRLEDTVRPGAAEDVAALSTFGHVTLVSDDSPSNTDALAQDVGLTHSLAEADATARLEQITKGGADGGRVVMVGLRSPLNEDAILAADLAVTTDAVSSPPPGAAILKDFTIAHAVHALSVLESFPDRVRRIRRLGLALSVVGDTIAAAAPNNWIPPTLGVGSTLVVAVAAAVTGRAGRPRRRTEPATSTRNGPASN